MNKKYLSFFLGKTFQLEKCVTSPEGGGSLSALAVSDCGTFVATGSMFDGTVELFVSLSLQVICVWKVEDVLLTHHIIYLMVHFWYLYRG